MTDFIPIARLEECPPGNMLRVSVNQQRLLLVNAEGHYYLIQEMCSHEEVSLYLGCLHGNTIKCSLHGSRFDLKTGEPLDEPADEALQTYPLKIDNGHVLACLS